ncbi:MAG: protein translocase subunit SecD [Clostridiales bacterium]|nr:protein translocase subunit SecD [Clostridiales bacterium]
MTNNLGGNNNVKKWQSIVILTVLAILIVLGSVFGFLTLDNGELGITNYLAYITHISLGLDLSGGVYAVYGVDEANLTDEQQEKLDSLIEGTRASLESLLFGKGYTEAQVTVSQNKIRVEIPDEDDPERIFNLIGRPSSLEFKEYVDGADGDLSLDDPNGKVKLDSKITGDDIANTGVSYDEETGYYVVSLAFTNAGSTKFAAATGALTGSQLSIWINDEFEIAPTVNATISSNASISGNYSYDEAYDLAVKIQAGSFPLVLKMEESNTITATLGSSAIKAGLISGIVGLVLIFIYLIAMYRLMGLAASLSLWYYSITYLFFLSIFPWVQLTLSGIAGVLLSIGMAVDANVIIFERIKEEYRGGKTMYTSITTGFKRSLGAILDGNITTIIGALVLIIVGASTIKSFGITLLIGLILSLLSSLLLMRLILNCFLVFNDESKAKAFGLKREVVEEQEDEVEEQSEEGETPTEKFVSKNAKKGGAVR